MNLDHLLRITCRLRHCHMHDMRLRHLLRAAALHATCMMMDVRYHALIGRGPRNVRACETSVVPQVRHDVRTACLSCLCLSPSLSPALLARPLRYSCPLLCARNAAGCSSASLSREILSAPEEPKEVLRPRRVGAPSRSRILQDYAPKRSSSSDPLSE